MAITDFVTFILSVLFLIQGASRGFLKSLMGPFSIIAATIASIIYYQITQDMIASLLIGLFGPLLLSLLLKFLLKTWTQTIPSVVNPGFLSRLGGAGLTLVWGWVFIVLALILLTVLPPWGKLQAVHDDAANSISYLAAARPVEMIFFSPRKQDLSAIQNETPGMDAKSLSQDPRFQTLLQDPDIQREIKNHDIAKLMSNPKMMSLVQQIMSDPATMQKVMAIYRSQLQPQVVKNP